MWSSNSLQKWAPNLHHCGSFQPVPVENQTSDDFPTGRSTQSIPGLHLNPMHMVVMDYIDASSEPLQDACSQVKEVLKYLHCNGYVFGDLQLPNILFNTNGKVKFVDFDWCEWYNMNIIDDDPENLAPRDVRQVQKENKLGSVPVDDEAHYPLMMSNIEDMWAPGMVPLSPI